jgi:hypothetical protein
MGRQSVKQPDSPLLDVIWLLWQNSAREFWKDFVPELEIYA